MTVENNIKYLIIAVIYNTFDDTIRFVESAKKNLQNYKIVLVDNSEQIPGNNFLQEIQRYNDVFYLKAPKNLGYFGGASWGLKYYLEQRELPKWIIVSNVDVVIDDSLIDSKLDDCENLPNIGIIAPSILSNNWGTNANPKVVERPSKQSFKFHYFVTLHPFIQNLYILLSYIKRWTKHFRASANKQTEVENKAIYAPHGAFIIFHENYFIHDNNLDHISFLFGEEFFVAENCRRTNLKVWFDSRIIIRDFEHASTGNFYSSKISGFMHQSIKDILKSYY